MQPSRRPKDGRYGENPNRLQHYYQFQVILKPNPPNLQELYLAIARRDRHRPAAARHPLRRGRLGEPDARRLGPRLGMLVRRHGGEPVHLFPAGRGLRMRAGRGRADLRARAPRHVRAGRRERLRPQLQRPRRATTRSPTATCSCRPSRNIRGTISRPPTPTMLFRHFRDAEGACRRYLDGRRAGAATARHRMALPAYDQCIKASHVFNLLDARGVISVTERQSYILRVRELAKACGAAWLQTEGGGRRRPRHEPLRARRHLAPGRLRRSGCGAVAPPTRSRPLRARLRQGRHRRGRLLRQASARALRAGSTRGRRRGRPPGFRRSP